MKDKINKESILKKVKAHSDDIKATLYLTIGILLFFYISSNEGLRDFLILSQIEFIFCFSIYAVTHWAVMKKYKPNWRERTVYQRIVSIYSIFVVAIFVIIFSLSGDGLPY